MILQFSPTLIVVPGSPAMVSDLAPADPAGEQLRQSVAQALSLVDDRPCEIVGSSDPRWRTKLCGSFAAWGAPQVSVGTGYDLAELIGRYVLGEKATAKTPFRSELFPLNPDAVTVVVLDGPAGLTPRAPLALVDGAAEVHGAFQRLLEGLHEEFTAQQLTSSGVIEPDLWLQLAQLRPVRATLLCADDTLGVGRYVACWEVEQ
ncbi:hypothetical protein [Corynebacterium cystitidis]|uniref:Uncharacterized protein n=1 Tax=Corynebacterium cystitidis DSM 20524 TaxID=1121357 RepID=A0A1H9P785_9CORY|nr:hypothetical protein [Corynebacterium cystitidis]WJY82607.1 hypothetical protein CCYS_08455 [Corynebacterium cystitidis DSM 20524]SER43669.1 hypothetical protein SAMN05661109_00227 [Corynebacterium cystitidis DSM 20524]SNV72843.1 Uncharacterised protein [Corynebacterium cystitidis]